MDGWLELNFDNKRYLVEWLGELLLVIKCVRKDKDIDWRQLPMYEIEEFELYKLDFTNKKWEEVNNLGEYCLILGHNTSVSILASDYSDSLQKNCIYFMHDFTAGCSGTKTIMGYAMGVFDLEDRRIRPHYKGISTCFYSPPLWFIPTLTMK
ncbi:hypothetical protein AQUCO_00700757v1 [Aquilegia coerulea]|uniref:KIB1-4 beta-propeller domain-containing protein n=1 Tax=Aquilegia coerulea TaxID=218851 RepID=A0A2G5ELN8_AQUCA|nr:hypothetical protein AQUCO_00700757v1 [Aquilegia coerulea]